MPVPGNTVRLVAIDGSDAAAAIRDKRIDAFVSIIAASAPKARALVEAVRGVGRAGKLDFVDVADSDAVIERFPRLQAVTVPAGLFGGRPKLPADDVKTVGASYRLMARTSLSRAVAADVTQHLFELRTAARRGDRRGGIRPGSGLRDHGRGDERPHPDPSRRHRQFRARAARLRRALRRHALPAGGPRGRPRLGGGWLRQRLASLRRERIDEVTDRLLEITDQARSLRDPETIAGLAVEIDRLAIEVVRDMRRRELDTRTMTAVSIAIETARATVADCRIVADGTGAPAAPPVRVTAPSLRS